MSIWTDAQEDATSIDGFANTNNGAVPTRYGGNKPSYQYLVDQWNGQIAAAILELNKSRGFRVVGTFAAGFTYELYNDVGIDANGDSWIYTDFDGTPVNVTAGTVPSAPTYTQVTFNNTTRENLAAQNEIDESLIFDLASGFGSGGNYFYLNNALYASTETLAANIDSINLSTMSIVAGGVTYYLYRTLKKGDVNLLSSWMPIGPINTTDCLPYIERAYAHNSNTIVNDVGEMWTMTLVDKLFDGSTRPTGLIMDQPNKTIEFEQGVKMTMATVTTGGKYQMFGISGADNSIVNPHLIGDKDTHTVDAGAPTGEDEQGYGIRVATGAENCTIVDPITNKFWGDGILWRNASKGGHIQGRHYSYDCRRQGISVIQCNGLKIDNTVGEEIGLVNGAENGPWSTLDVEPDQNSQDIVGLEVGTVEGINNKGTASLLALLKLDSTSSDVDIVIGSVISKGCLRAFETRVDNNVVATINVNYVHGTDSRNQDFQTVCFNDTASLTINTMISVNCNRDGLSTSAFSTPVGIYKNYAAESNVGNIRIKSLTIINDETTLRHPVSLFNTFDSVPFGKIQIDEIVQTSASFIDGSVHNNAVSDFRTNSRIKKSFTASATISNSQWVNSVDNTGATGGGAILITAPASYGYEGMEFEIERTTSDEIRVKFDAGLENDDTIRSGNTGVKAVTKKTGGQWSIVRCDAGQWNLNGTTRLHFGFSAGGSTANRPTNPINWMKYSDVTLGYDIVYNPIAASWVKADDYTQLV